MSKFLESAAARETSPELMEAIRFVAGGDDARAAHMWANGITGDELVSIIERVTHNGLHEPTDFVWGAMGSHWAIEDPHEVIFIAGNPKCPADVVYAGLTRDDAQARCDALNRETRGALGRYAVRHA